MNQPLDNVVLIGRYDLDPDADIIGAHQLTIDAEITYRQLDYWTRLGYLTPLNDDPSIGHPRVYPIDQVALAREIGRLVRAGVRDVSTAHDVAVALLADGHADLGDFTIRPRQETA